MSRLPTCFKSVRITLQCVNQYVSHGMTVWCGWAGVGCVGGGAAARRRGKQRWTSCRRSSPTLLSLSPSPNAAPLAVCLRFPASRAACQDTSHLRASYLRAHAVPYIICVHMPWQTSAECVARMHTCASVSARELVMPCYNQTRTCALTRACRRDR